MATADSRYTPSQQAGAGYQFSAIDRTPPLQQGLLVISTFQNARTISDYKRASELWEHVRPNLTQYEKALNCEDYTQGAQNKKLLVDTVEDIVKKPVGLVIAVCEFVISFAGQDEKELVHALKEIVEELKKEAGDKLKEKLIDKAKEAIKSHGPSVTDRLRELLLRYLQAVSRRSRKHFVHIIDNLMGAVKGAGALVLVAGKVAFTPTEIAPESCGVVESIRFAQQEAFNRIFVSGNIISQN